MRNKIREDQVTCFFVYVDPRTDKITMTAARDDFDIVMITDTLNMFGVDHIIEPSVLRDLTNYGIQSRR